MDFDKWLSHKGLEYREGRLHFGDYPLDQLAEQFGTPLFVINEDILRKRYRELKKVLSRHYGKIRIHYAVKSNTNLSVLRILQQEGAYVDVVSPGEVFLARQAGFEPDHILYTGNNWTDSELEYALENGIMINLDAISHIKRLANLCEKHGYELPLLSFRVNPEYGGGHHDHCITAGPQIKFGIFESQVLEAYQIALDHGFTKFGIHMHIGSGILEITPFQQALKKYFEIIEKVVKEKQIKFDFIDFGGGIGIPYRADETPIPLEEYASTLMDDFKENIKKLDIPEPIFAIEPGRYISAEASVIVSQINTYKDTGFKIFIGIDAGFNTLIRPAFYGSYHEIIPVLKGENREDIVADIVGQLCESGDVLGKMRTIKKPNEGEFLAILDAGAYGFSMSSTYNSRPRAAEILISKENLPEIIREREAFDDLIRHQIIPDRLK